MAYDNVIISRHLQKHGYFICLKGGQLIQISHDMNNIAYKMTVVPRTVIIPALIQRMQIIIKLRDK